jgi:hypothetical protein
MKNSIIAFIIGALAGWGLADILSIIGTYLYKYYVL